MNFTVGVSFGCQREIEFIHLKSKHKQSFVLQDGMTYVFTEDIKEYWEHSIPEPRNEHGKVDGK